MSTVTDPRLDATRTYSVLTERLLCARPCPCAKAANRSSGQVHCPACTGHAPTLQLAVKGGTLDLGCSAGCPDENVWVAVADLLADGDPHEVYRYVDTAAGGTDHRNHVRRLEAFHAEGRTDVVRHLSARHSGAGLLRPAPPQPGRQPERREVPGAPVDAPVPDRPRP